MEEFKRILLEHLEDKKYHNSVTNEVHLTKKFPQIANYIKGGENYSAKLYCFINDTKHPKCKFCGEPYAFVSFKKGFLKKCSKKCKNTIRTLGNDNYEKYYTSAKVCERHNTIISRKVFETLLRYEPEVFCEKCSYDIISKGIFDLNVVEKSKDSLINLFKDRKKIDLHKIKLFYPHTYLYVDSLSDIRPSNFLNKLNYFLYDYSMKCENCGKNVNFDKNSKPKKLCNDCIRKKNSKKGREISNVEYWTNYFKHNFNISCQIKINDSNVILTDPCKHHQSLEIKKNTIKLKNKRGIHHLCVECNKEYYLSKNEPININNFKNKWNLIKTLSDEKLLNYNPYIWAAVQKHMKDTKSSFSESKFCLRYDITNKPKCSVCGKDAIFSNDAYDYLLHCEEHLNSYYTSSSEIEIKDYLKSINVDFLSNDRKILNKKELDIFIPSHKLGIEYNGLYWHSEFKLQKKYHYDKLSLCKKNDVSLLTVWEDDWSNKKDIIKSIIKNNLGLNERKIYARETTLKILDNDQKSSFLEKNHLQGNVHSHLNFGLFYKDELVSVMTFGKKRMVLNSLSENVFDYELIRYCNLINTTIIGGASKLFNHFIKNYKFDSIVSYCNLDISNGKIYELLGFKNEGFCGLNYWWAKNGKKYHRSNFMKHKLVKAGHDKSLSESEIMKKDGYFKIWGTGNDKWVYKNPSML